MSISDRLLIPRSFSARLTHATLLLSTLFASATCAQSSTEPATTELPAIEVTGQTHGAEQPAHATHSPAAKSDAPLRELPQSVQVITGQTITDLGATKLDNVLDYVSGVTRGNSFGGLQDDVMVRGLPGGRGGFGADALMNGFSTVRGNPVACDLAGVAQVSVLKGPTAALYGGGSPGGLLNVESKRPLWAAAHEVFVSAGSDDFKRAAFDSGGPLGEHVAYRLNVAAENGGSFRDHIKPHSRLLAPALTWVLNNNTSLEYVGEIIERHAPQDRGILAVNGKLGALPRTRFLAEPDDGNFYAKNNTQQLMLTHDWNAGWSSRAGVQYRTTDLRGLSSNLRTPPMRRAMCSAPGRTPTAAPMMSPCSLS